MKNQILSLVSQICNTESTNCRNLNKSEIARNLMDLANIPSTATIQEIPLCWNNQVVILFLLPNDTNYYSLFAGIGKSGNFCFELSITGVVNENGKEFDFYEEEQIVSIDYFKHTIKEREYNIAKEFDIVDMVEKLQRELLEVNGITEVEFDLCGFYDNLNQVIILTKYNIPCNTEGYYEKRKKLINQVVGVAEGNFLTRTQDSIEDYGEHFYFVFHCFKEWNK